MADLINLLVLLHSKTTFYKEIDLDWYKYIYESVDKRIDDTYRYYNEVMDNIDETLFMSPASYLIARNITSIYKTLNYAKNSIHEWYKMIENTRRVRVVMSHNNLSMDHYIKSDKPYFISFDKAKIDMPINDLVNLYKEHYLEFDFANILKMYMSKYPLTKEEVTLFLTILSIPQKLSYNNLEYRNVLTIRREIDYIYKVNELIKELASYE